MMTGLSSPHLQAWTALVSAVREFYVVGPAAAPREELMTRLIIPVQESMA